MLPSFISSVPFKPVKGQPICPVCHENFDDTDRSPRIFICGHSVCFSCSEKLVEMRRFSNPYQQVSVSCPVCRIATLWYPDGGFRTNFDLLSAIESLMKNEHKRVSLVKCSECEEDYNEKDTHICKFCSSSESIDFEMVNSIPDDFNLEKVAICSTCVLKKHNKTDHICIPFQNVRVEHQFMINSDKIEERKAPLLKMSESASNVLSKTLETLQKCIMNSRKYVHRFEQCNTSEEQVDTIKSIFIEIDTVSQFVQDVESSCATLNQKLEEKLQRLNLTSPSSNVDDSPSAMKFLQMYLDEVELPDLGPDPLNMWQQQQQQQ